MESLEEFLKLTETRLKEIMEELGWNYNRLSQHKMMTKCPINSEHILASDNVETHIEKCKWQSMGYNSSDVPLSEAVSTSSSLCLTPQLQKQIIYEACGKDPLFVKGNEGIQEVPQTSNRRLQIFTRDERRALYDYVVANTEPPKQPPEVPLILNEETGEKREMTAAEIAAMERDAKRRRATYRNKVHTNRKTQVEVMREVIESQMNCLFADHQKKEPEVFETKADEDKRASYYSKDSNRKDYRKHQGDHSSNDFRQTSGKDFCRKDEYEISYTGNNYETHFSKDGEVDRKGKRYSSSSSKNKYNRTDDRGREKGNHSREENCDKRVANDYYENEMSYDGDYYGLHYSRDGGMHHKTKDNWKRSREEDKSQSERSDDAKRSEKRHRESEYNKSSRDDVKRSEKRHRESEYNKSSREDSDRKERKHHKKSKHKKSDRSDNNDRKKDGRSKKRSRRSRSRESSSSCDKYKS